MAASKPICREIACWLRANFHTGCLAPLTGTDGRALQAAVHILELWQQCYGEDKVKMAQAFGAVVSVMQPKCHYLAYHLIAMVDNWETRAPLWELAGLPPIENPGICKFEAEGRRIAA